MVTIKKIGHVLTLSAIGLCVFSGTLLAVATDIGMVTRLEGQVVYWNDTEGQAQQTAQNFMKVRGEDHFDLKADARLQLVFFASGRRELWQGPMRLKVTDAGAKIVEGGLSSTSPIVTLLPETVSKEMQRISPLIEPDKLHRSGSTIVRGKRENAKGASLPASALSDKETAAVEAARKTYNDLAGGSAEDDITPELFLFSVLADYDQFDEMDGLLKKMRAKQPENPAVERLAVWLDSQK